MFEQTHWMNLLDFQLMQIDFSSIRFIIRSKKRSLHFIQDNSYYKFIRIAFTAFI